jgi:leader peptidase (prepilin peptidase)/N-methyltransferase
VALVALFTGVAIRFHGNAGELALGLVFVSILVAITLTDLERRIIPNKVLAVGAVIGLAIVLVSYPGSLPERLAAAAGAGGVLFIAAIAYPGGMGLGDVKLAAVMGLFLGVWVIPAMLIGLLAGSVAGMAIIVRDGVAARKQAIPFGPFLALGGICALFAGAALIQTYLSTFS